MAFYDVGRSFVWFIGIVEDVNDPLMLGRVKIRILNDQDSNEVETDELLWATPISPIQSASLNNSKIESASISPGPGSTGASPTGVEVGTFAFGFFADGEEKNMPFFFGTYHKIPSATRENIKQAYKADDHDVSSLAREQQTLYKENTKSDLSLVSEDPLYVKIDSENPYIKEPNSAYKAKYPHNKTFTTKSGHAIEIDDTPGDERIHVYHKSGTYEETNVDGRRVQKIVGSDWEIIKKNKRVLVKGNLNVEVDGNATVLVKGNSYNWIGGNVTQHIVGNASQTIDENVSQTIGGNVTQIIGGDLSQTVKGNLHQLISNDYTLEIRGKYNVKINGDVNISNESDMTIHSEGTQTIGGETAQKLLTDGIQTLNSAANETNIENDTNITGTSTASVDHVSNGISGYGHTHTNQGLGDETTPPN